MTTGSPTGLENKIARLPESAGVYLFRSAEGKTLYVGKAASVKARVLSHLRTPPPDARKGNLLSQIADVEVVLTDSAREALHLENNLIKTRRPRYNILLRDDKNPPLVRLTMNEKYPRVHIVRGAGTDGAVYAGPYFPASLARRSMSLVHRLFGIRNCREQLNGKRPRPCLQYQIRRCVAPCVDSICSVEEYRETSEAARLFLLGRTTELSSSLTRRMREEAEAERFEEAARLRDSLKLLAELNDRQKMAAAEGKARDVFGLYREGDRAQLQVFLVRGGKVVDRDTFSLSDLPPVDDAGLVEAAMKQFYEMGRLPPPRIEAPLDFPERELVAEWLGEKRGGRVEVHVPVKGARRRMVDLVCRNARLAFDLDFREAGRKAAARVRALQEALQLPAEPRRIEAFDVSNLGGRQVVASMVVFERGEPLPSAYRKFRIRTVKGKPDDYASMREVVLRRYRRVLTEGAELPDLILVDGGRGQLGSAAAALHDLGLTHIPHAGLAKREEEIFLPGAAGAAPAAPELSGAPSPRTRPGRGAPIRHHLPPQEPPGRDAPFGARRGARHRPPAAAGAADPLRQPAPGHGGLRSGARRNRGPGAGRDAARPPPSRPVESRRFMTATDTSPRRGRKRLLSGMRPTGSSHLGHLVGAYRNWVAMQDEFDAFYCIVDWHALTTDYKDTSDLRASTLEIATDWLAVGLDPKRCTLFVQSQVPEHAELHLLLSMVVPLGWLERVPTYKELIKELKEKDLHTYGFLGYPVLQAADILMYDAAVVPVGEDQKPHVELTREIARRFNQFYGDVVTEPDVRLTPSPRLPGTDGRKMSKSYGNVIGIAEDEDSVRGKLKTMMTDPARKRLKDPGDPAKCPVFDLHRIFSDGETQNWAAEGCRTAGIGCIQCKNALADHLVAEIAPIGERRREYEKRPDDVRDVLAAGRREASEAARATMERVRAAVRLPEAR